MRVIAELETGVAGAMRSVLVVSPKGGTGKSMVATVMTMAIALRGVRVGLLDLSMVNPSQEFRSGVLSAGASVPTLDELPPVSSWWLEATTGYRLLSAPRSVAQRTAESMVGWATSALRAAGDAGLEVMVIDVDGLSNNALHRALLESIDEVVFVVDNSALTAESGRRTIDVLQSPHDLVRNGLPLVPIDRCSFVFCSTRGAGTPAMVRRELEGRGRWLGHVSYSEVLDGVGDAGRLAYACPPEVLVEADGIVARLLPALPARVVRPVQSRRGRGGRSAAGEAGWPAPPVDSAGVLRVFDGPASPRAMGGVEFGALAAIAAWKFATVELLADTLEVPAKQMRRVTKALREAGLVELEGEIICPAPLRVDVDELSAISRRLAAGEVLAPEVLVRTLSAVKAPAYGGGVGGWSFTRQGGQRGVPLVLRAEEALLGLAEQIARSAAAPTVVDAAIGALSRAGVAVPPGLAQLAASPMVAVAAAEPSSEPATEVLGAAPAAFPAPTGPSVEPAISRVLAVPPVVASTVVVRGGAQRPRMMVRLFGQVDVQRWSAGDSVVSRGLAVPVALAVLGRAAPQSELCELTGYSEPTLKNTFPAGHQVVGRDRGVLFLGDGVFAEHEWLATLVRASAESVRAGRTGDAVAAVTEALGFAQSVSGRPFEVCPRSPERRGSKRDVWAWVDEPLPGEWRSGRDIVGRRWVESLVMAVRLWRDLSVASVFPEPLVVDLLCRAAWMVPLVAVPTVAIDGWSDSAHVLLLEAKKVAGRSPEMVGQVHAIASELVGSGELDPDAAFANALGMPLA